MREVQVLPLEKLGHNFIPARYLPEGKDEYYLRNQQNPKPAVSGGTSTPMRSRRW